LIKLLCALSLQVQQVEATEFSIKLSMRLCNSPWGWGKSTHNASTGIQNEIFMQMTMLTPSIYQIHMTLLV